MKMTLVNITGLSIGVTFLILSTVSFVIYPEIGEKILYGKHPPIKNSEHSKTATYWEYSEIMTSGNDMCIEYATGKASGDLNKFVEEFNDCNSQ